MELLVELLFVFVAACALVGEILARRFPILGNVFFVLLILLITGCAAISLCGGYAMSVSDDETTRSLSSFLYCLGGLLVLFAPGRILKRLVPYRLNTLVSVVALTVAAAAMMAVAILCFMSRIYSCGIMIISLVFVCVVYAALCYKNYKKANNGQ